MKVSDLLIVATLLAGSDARSETMLDKLARIGGLIMGYEVACAVNHGSLGQQVVERLQKRAELAGYSFMNPDFMDLINIHAKQSIAGFKSDAGQLCLQTKIEIDKIMRGAGP